MRGAAGAGTALATLCILAAAGCGGPSGPRTLASGASLEAISGRMMDMVSDNGIPLQDDYIRCVATLDRRAAVCHGQTASEPAKDIKGTFSSSPSVPGQTGCPGTLTVSVGPPLSDFDVPGPVSHLQSRKMNPCL